ncbi:hypothetical protein C9374_000791 [Naegleria lovaniensis]|uniref:GyrI-like small molecule binding domain-containing protein n=1 Tax=Naegleria lovaniensis TaxID=51637 RepID=A0AA88KNT6_NAELO|nr:uncharacterized protein C9374_000791 [Naegleria lovaniensis]KAG2387941.1 hypothetical protein C9374_000791 [Naegleria lovaniensis]
MSSHTQTTTKIDIPSPTLVTLPQKFFLGIKRNHVSLVSGNFGEWIQETYRQAIEAIPQLEYKAQTSIPIAFYHRFGSHEDVDLENAIFVDLNELGVSVQQVKEKLKELNHNAKNKMEINSIENGEYLTLRFVGPYDMLEQVWSKFMKSMEELQYEMAGPCWEEYWNSPTEVKSPNELITVLYQKVAPKKK